MKAALEENERFPQSIGHDGSQGCSAVPLPTWVGFQFGFRQHQVEAVILWQYRIYIESSLFD